MLVSWAQFSNPCGRKDGKVVFRQQSLLEYWKQYSCVLKMSKPIYRWSAGSSFDNCCAFMGWPAGVSAGNRCRSFSARKQNKRGGGKVIKVCSSYADLHLCGKFKKGGGQNRVLAARQREGQCIMGARAVGRHLPFILPQCFRAPHNKRRQRA